MTLSSFKRHTLADVLAAGPLALDPIGRVSSSAAYEAYVGWARTLPSLPLGRVAFRAGLVALGVVPYRTGSGRFLRGVALVERAAPGDGDPLAEPVTAGDAADER